MRDKTKGYCGRCGKKLTGYDRSVDACDRCGTEFSEKDPVGKAGDAEKQPDYPNGVFKE